jgi:hypothetical protein
MKILPENLLFEIIEIKNDGIEMEKIIIYSI